MITIRTKTKKIQFNNIIIGGNEKIYIQSMTNTKTSNVNKTISQINKLFLAGCDYVRVAVFDIDDANSLKKIVSLSPIPIVADIHFNFEFALIAISAGVKKIRLNPGNLDDDEKIKKIVTLAKENNVVIRIGVNSGSLPEWIINKYGNNELGMIELTKHYVKKLERLNFTNIVLSLKSSDVQTMINVNNMAAKEFKYPLHLGVTESGPELEGTIKSVAGLTPLLISGIGNTIRISITDNPVKEVYIARKLLNNLGFINNSVDIISCPTCGRLQYKMLPLVKKINKYTQNLNFPLKISILGCVVNGIGEGKKADIGVAGGNKKGVLFKKGKIIKTVHEDQIYDELIKLIDEEFDLYKKTNMR